MTHNLANWKQQSSWSSFNLYFHQIPKMLTQIKIMATNFCKSRHFSEQDRALTLPLSAERQQSQHRSLSPSSLHNLSTTTTNTQYSSAESNVHLLYFTFDHQHSNMLSIFASTGLYVLYSQNPWPKKWFLECRYIFSNYMPVCISTSSDQAQSLISENSTHNAALPLTKF